MPPQRIRSRPPRDKRQLCRCSRCIARNPQGRWYNRSTVWRHAHSDVQTIRDRALLTCRDCAEEHQVLAEEIEAHRRDARSQRLADSFSRPDAYTQDIADFSSVIDEQVSLEEELEEGERALRQVSENLTTDENSDGEIEFDGDEWPSESEESTLNLYHSSRLLTGKSHTIITCISPLGCTSGYSRARFHESITTVLEIYCEPT